MAHFMDFMEREEPRSLNARSRANGNPEGTRTRNGTARPQGMQGWRSAGRSALRLAAAVVLAVGVVMPATAAELVGNLGQTTGLVNEQPLDARSFAQKFTTGANGDGYGLTSVELEIVTGAAAATVPVVKVFSTSATGTLVATLTGPTSLDASTTKAYAFAAPANTVLSRLTSYWVVVEHGTGSGAAPRPVYTPNLDKDATSERDWDWTIGRYEFRMASASGAFTQADDDHALQFRVNGTERNNGGGNNLLSNFQEPQRSGPWLVDSLYRTAQGFRTGPNAGGYTFLAARVGIRGACTKPLAFALHAARHQEWLGATGPVPAEELVALEGDGTATGDRTFTAATATRLEPSTDYFIVMKYGAGAGTMPCLLYRIDGWAVEDNGGTPPWECNTAGWCMHTSTRKTWNTGGFSWYQNGTRWGFLRTRLKVEIRGLALGGASGTTAPTVTETPAVSEAGNDGEWTVGETVEVTFTFSEAVDVETTGGTPTIGLSLGGTEARSASYVRGTGTTELVFSYTLVDGDGSHTLMMVSPNSLVLNGGTIRSQASATDATLTHIGVSAIGVAGQDGEADGATARFDAVPENHNGADVVEFELHFSEEPEGLSYTTVGGGLLEVTGGSITGARRLTAQDNSGWEVSAQPSGNADVVITLPNRACDQANAVCIGGQPLAAAVSVTIPGPEQEQTGPLAPFTASFAGRVPTEHDGAASTRLEFQFHLSHNPGHLSYETVRDDLFTVTGGSIESASRRTQGDEKHMHWDLKVDPAGAGDVTIALKPTTDCAGTPGVCRLADNAMLNSYLRQVIKGPATLSVADATVEEADGATLDFVVTLSRTRLGATTVRYATSDGTATEGADYTATSGTLTFGFNETSKTVSVPVLDDVHDDNNETVTLTLSNPTPSAYVRIADGTATGTITNSDPLQRAWLSRFGRTVGTHVTEAVSTRFRGGAADTHVTVGGYRLPLGRRGAAASPPPTARLRALATASDEPAGAADEPADEPTGGTATAVLTEVARVLGMGPGGAGPAPEGADSDAGVRWDPRLGQSRTLDVGQTLGQTLSQTFDLRRLLLGSSFRLNLHAGDAEGALPRLTAWGQVAGTTFDGQDGDLALDGDVLTGTVGVDGTWDRVVAGVAVAHSLGDGGYRTPGLGARGQGALESTLTSLHPYLRYAVTERLDVWGVLGYGWGDSEVALGTGETLETDTTLLMGAFGSRGILLAPAATGGVQLATRTDAMFTRTSSDAVTGNAGTLAASEADAHRLRMILEGQRAVTWADGRRLTPTVELGVRHDWGDAETGFGLEVGGRVQYADPRLGLTVDGTVRALLAHEDTDYQEWGASGTVRVDPGATGQGLALTLAPAWGATGGGVDGLWARQTTQGLTPSSRQPRTGQLAADVGYGFPLFETGLLTPYAGTVAATGAARTYRLGTRLRLARRGATGLEMTLEGTRQDPTGLQPVNQGLRFQVTWGF